MFKNIIGNVICMIQHSFGCELCMCFYFAVPPDLFLLGCIFFIVDYESSMPEEVVVWQRVIASSGGEVETVYGPRVTHVLCETQKSAAFHRVILYYLFVMFSCYSFKYLECCVTCCC
jgi:hypothetical protein